MLQKLGKEEPISVEAKDKNSNRKNSLQNPKLLIMDEATSALDYETERKVSLNLMEFFRGTQFSLSPIG